MDLHDELALVDIVEADFEAGVERTFGLRQVIECLHKPQRLTTG